MAAASSWATRSRYLWKSKPYSSSPDLAPVVALPAPPWQAVLAEYLRRYTNQSTADSARRYLTRLLAPAGGIDGLSIGDVIAWASADVDSKHHPGSRPAANNTVRQRLATARQFFAWCRRHGIDAPDPTDDDLVLLRKSYPKLYGKTQGNQPARFLSHAEAFGALLDACNDGTPQDIRDTIAIRLGLGGTRADEAVSLTWGDRTDGELRWIGKKRRSRFLVIGPTLAGLLDTWHELYAQQLGRPIRPADPILCRCRHVGPVGGPRTVLIGWGHPLGYAAYYSLLSRRAAAAGLGSVAPHDLRRTCANILHNARTPDGAHLFDLLDIQQVLDHADPNTTQRSYIDHLSAHDTKARASRTLD